MSAFKTKKDLIVESVREAILTGELEPGERLLQTKLAERYDVSPTPVREALRQLEAEGILHHRPHKGIRVAEVKLEDVREIYLIRGAVEALATRLAVAHLTEADIATLESLQTQIEAKIADDNLNELRRLNYQFHMRIYQAANMPELSKIIRSLWMKFPWDTLHVIPGRAVESAEEHRKVIEAVRAGQAEQAAQAVQEHIECGAFALAEYLASIEADEDPKK